MEVTPHFHAVGRTLGSACVSWPTSDDMDHSLCCKELKHVVVNVWERHGLARLLSTLGSAHLVR